jgi:homoaconitase/3-isopropylmalate dehydratase large subunit
MHTEFCRERAQPGMLVIGSDSHTCSAGSVGALAIGLGVADVIMPLILGETWFRIPETINIRLINAPSPGIGGKDTILYIMKELKRNTVAADRIVEFTGPGLEHLSCDARFAISNMTTVSTVWIIRFSSNVYRNLAASVASSFLTKLPSIL